MSSTARPLLTRNQSRLGCMAWAHFLNDGSANYLPGVLPAILISMNLSVSYAGVFMAALLVGQGLQPLVGLVADRIGGRAFVLAGLLGTAVGGALVGLMPNEWSLIAVLIGIGLCNALFHPQALAGVRMLSEGKNAGASMSVLLVGGEIGRGLWPLLASWLVTISSINVLWVLSIPALLTLPLLWYWAPSLPARRTEAEPLRIRAHAGPLSVLVGFCALRSLMLYGLITFLPLLWYENGGSLTGGASIITVLMLVGIVGNLGGGQLGDHIGRRPIIIGGIIASVILLVGFLQTGGAVAWVFLALLGVALFSTLPLTVLIAQDILPENRSLGSGLALGFANAVGALCIIGLGPVADAWGAGAVIWVTVACGIIAIPLAIALPEHDKRNSVISNP